MEVYQRDLMHEFSNKIIAVIFGICGGFFFNSHLLVIEPSVFPSQINFFSHLCNVLFWGFLSGLAGLAGKRFLDYILKSISRKIQRFKEKRQWLQRNKL